MDRKEADRKCREKHPIVSFRLSLEEKALIEMIKEPEESISQAIARIFRKALKDY